VSSQAKHISKPVGFIHTAFGLKIYANAAVPGLEALDDSEAASDLQLQLGVSPHQNGEARTEPETLAYETSDIDASGRPALRIWNTADGIYLRLEYCDGTQFWLEHYGREIWAIWPERATLEDTCSYLLGPVFGLLLRLRGITCLHASAVALRGQCVAFVGPEGAGKSTTAAAFAREGHAVLSDDVVALAEKDSQFMVAPAYPHLCLWPDSTASLYGAPDAIPPFSQGWEKKRLTLGDKQSRFESRSLPLAAVYLLGERRAERAPFVEAVRPQVALLSLVADTFANKVLNREMRAREFEVLGHLVSRVPVRRVFPHSDPYHVGDLCRLIEEDLAAFPNSAHAHP